MSKSVFDQCAYVPCVLVLAEKDPTTITPGGHQCVAQHKAKDVERRKSHLGIHCNSVSLYHLPQKDYSIGVVCRSSLDCWYESRNINFQIQLEYKVEF